MNYFSQFLRPSNQPTVKPVHDHALEFHKSWSLIKNTLLYPDERQLSRGIQSTDVPAHLQSMVDALVWESTRTEEGGTGACLEYLLKNDVLGTLVKLSEPDRPSGIQAEVLRAIQNMVVLMDEQFLVHSAVHRAVLRLLRNCVGDDLQEQLDGRNKIRGAAGNAIRTQPSEYEEDLVNLLCILCSRIRTYRELLMIFFHDKHWYRSEPLFSVDEEDENAEDDNEEDETEADVDQSTDPCQSRVSSPTPSQETITSAPVSSLTKKPEYEFLLFNYLLRFVHREGTIGDFARAGLLFLMDVAMSPGEPVHRFAEGSDVAPSPAVIQKDSPPSDPVADAALALAEYILDGDFSEVLAAGLGAVYSLLPSKLEIRRPLPASDSSMTGMLLGGTGLDASAEAEKAEEESEQARAVGLEFSSNPDFISRLDHFLKLLEFLQDVLRRNVHDAGPDSSIEASALVGTAIVQSILDAVRRIFLENILYPSVLECSHTDGSAVAVMSYIEIMIRTLQGGQLARLLVDFLTSEDNEEISRSRPRYRSLLTLGNNAPPRASDKTNKLRRRKSSAMALLEMEAPDSRRQSEYFTTMGRFTLKDLLLSNLRSSSYATATAALQLLNTMFLQYCQLSVDRLLIAIMDPHATTFPEAPVVELQGEINVTLGDEDEDEVFIYPGTAGDMGDVSLTAIPSTSMFIQPDKTYSTHEREMGLYLTLVSRIDPSHDDDAFSTGYDHYLRDALFAIRSHTCFDLDMDHESRTKRKHRLNANDPVLSVVLDSLRKFFANTPEFNVALTGVLATLALCPDRSLAGWLTFGNDDNYPEHSSERELDGGELDGDGDDRSIDYQIEEKLAHDAIHLPASSIDEQSRPVIHTILQGLVAELERYRQLVENFDQYLLQRRQGLLFSENLTDALTLSLDMSAESVTIAKQPVSPAPAIKPPQKSKAKSTTASSIVSFLSPRRSKPSSAKSAPPATPPRRSENSVAPGPFGSHYEQTGSIIVEPFVPPLPDSGPWTPVKTPKWIVEEEDVFSSKTQWGDKETSFEHEDAEMRDSQNTKAPTVTLSTLLDHVVILEESIKELVSIIHARRSLGIDSIRYL